MINIRKKSSKLAKPILTLCALMASMAFIRVDNSRSNGNLTPPQYPTTLTAEQLPESCSNITNPSFQSGEELTYKIYYNLNFVWLSAGEVTFSVVDEGSRYHLSATGKTYSSYEWFYKVNDTYDSYVDKQTLLPQTSIRTVSENKYSIYDKVDYDQKNRKATYERGKTRETATLHGTVALNDCMHDVLSIIYYCRTLDYAPASQGQEYPVKVLLDEETYALKYKFLQREEKKIRGLGTYAAMRFSPQLVAGNVFNEKTQMKIWASDDANKIPLMIESPVSVGSVKIVLKSWKGLKYDFTAKKD